MIEPERKRVRSQIDAELCALVVFFKDGAVLRIMQKEFGRRVRRIGQLDNQDAERLIELLKAALQN